MAKAEIREFQLDLIKYIESNTPVTVTRNGETAGYFIPTPRAPQAHIAALEQASERLNRLIDENGAEVEEIAAEYDAVRRKAAQKLRSKSNTA